PSVGTDAGELRTAVPVAGEIRARDLTESGGPWPPRAWARPPCRESANAEPQHRTGVQTPIDSVTYGWHSTCPLDGCGAQGERRQTRERDGKPMHRGGWLSAGRPVMESMAVAGFFRAQLRSPASGP